MTANSAVGVLAVTGVSGLSVSLSASSRIAISGEGPLAQGGALVSLAPADLTSISYASRGVVTGEYTQRPIGDVTVGVTSPARWKEINNLTGTSTVFPVSKQSALHVLGSLTSAGVPLSWRFADVTALSWTAS